MNKKLFTMSLAMMGLCTFTACSSSNDDDKKDDKKEIVIQDAEYDAIINQYVDNVVMPTYSDLKEKNSDLYLSVVDFGNAPSDAKFQAICDAWLAAREPWEQSEAFLFGPVADFGLDPNMDSWPLDQEAIVNTLKSQQWNDMTWSGDYDVVSTPSSSSLSVMVRLVHSLTKQPVTTQPTMCITRPTLRPGLSI